MIDQLDAVPALAHRFSVFVIEDDALSMVNNLQQSGLLGEGEGDLSFQSIRGLEVRTQTTTIDVGGMHHRQFKLPVKNEFTDLVMSKGKIVTRPTKTTEWLLQILLQSNKIQKQNIVVTLNGEGKTPIAAWLVLGAYPVHWKLNNLNAEKSAIAIEEITLTYSSFKPITI